MKSGYVLVNKPGGITSHDVVDRVRRATGVKRVGHAGTLDPLATGLLIVLVGREATREQERFMKQDKEYVATMELGKVSDTYDSEGVVEETLGDVEVSKEQVTQVIKEFIGEIDQAPPVHSAIKVGGKKAYELARKGEEVKLGTRKIQISEIELLEFNSPFIKLKVSCGSGTYIRSLVHDIGQNLGSGAIMTELERTKIGPYSVDDAVDIEAFSKNPEHYIMSI